MAATTAASGAKSSAKRKRIEKEQPPKKRAKSRPSESDSGSDDDDGDDEDDAQAEILKLESQILESKKNYNSIVTLLDMVKKPAEDGESSVVAAVVLCRVFIRLLAAGKLAEKKGLSEKEAVVVSWLRTQLSAYKQALFGALEQEKTASTALTVAMRLLKAEAQHLDTRLEYTFPRYFLMDIIRAISQPEVDTGVRSEFVEKFVDEYHDVRFYTFQAVQRLLEDTSHQESLSAETADSLLEILLAIDGVPDEIEADEEDFYIHPPKTKKHALLSLLQHKRQAQDAWLAVMRLGLDKRQRKRVLEAMDTTIAPWFIKPEFLMDFLTDCYDAGGSVSLLALSGVFYLIQERNLDYPQFYRKLYSLLDADTLHSKHRSRLLRLLDTFLASSHLPAVLIASFIKRLSRLSLNAPPAAIVAIVPWFYNLFQRHPLTTFMMHRVPRTPEDKERIEREGMADPFIQDEEDPMETRAIDSCLWEIVQLQAHYHPNVATIAKIISEQFTKQMYNVEDFLDHSYASLLQAEMAKDVKKPPVVEFMIPKRIFSPLEAGSEGKDSLLVDMWDFSS